MSTETTPRVVVPPPRVVVPPPRPPGDGRGRVTVSDAEWQERMARLAEVFARYDAEPVDEPPGLDEEIMREIDECRPHRPLFEGLY